MYSMYGCMARMYVSPLLLHHKTVDFCSLLAQKHSKQTSIALRRAVKAANPLIIITNSSQSFDFIRKCIFGKLISNPISIYFLCNCFSANTVCYHCLFVSQRVLTHFIVILTKFFNLLIKIQY